MSYNPLVAAGSTAFQLTSPKLSAIKIIAAAPLFKSVLAYFLNKNPGYLLSGNDIFRSIDFVEALITTAFPLIAVVSISDGCLSSTKTIGAFTAHGATCVTSTSLHN